MFSAHVYSITSPCYAYNARALPQMGEGNATFKDNPQYFMITNPLSISSIRTLFSKTTSVRFHCLLQKFASTVLVVGDGYVCFTLHRFF